MLWDKLTVDEHFELFARAYGYWTSSTQALTGRHTCGSGRCQSAACDAWTD